MKDFRHLALHVRRYGKQHQALYSLALMILFWSVFDGTTTYITPLIMTEAGMTKTLIGIIIGSSSVFGAVFDFLMCRLFKRGHFRRIFMLMFGLCFAYLAVLYLAQSVALFGLAMALWGVYYDLKNFGSFDFVSRFVKVEEYTSSFGVLSVFQAVGYLLAPIMAGFLIGQTVGGWPFAAAAVFLAIAGLFLFRLLVEDKKLPHKELKTSYNYKGFFQEIKLWLKIDRVLLPVLSMMMTLNIIEAFFWTIGPLLAESFRDIHPLAGFFMTAYTLPPLLVGWLVGGATVKLGKKKVSYLGLLLGSLLLSLMKFIDQSALVILDVFIASFFIAFSWPAIRAAFADYIKETRKYEKEIEGLEDFYTNLGFVIGPILAGVIADKMGNQTAFSVLGIFGAMMALLLFKITPRQINVLKDIRVT